MLIKLLKFLAKFTLWRFEPKIIGVAGILQRPSTMEAVGAVLKFIDGKTHSRIRIMKGSRGAPRLAFVLNILGELSDLDLDLILNKAESLGSFIRRLSLIIKLIVFSVTQIFVKKQKDYPEILVLEHSINLPKDMEWLLNIASPNIGILTQLGEISIPNNIGDNAEEIFRETAKFIEQLSGSDFAVLNCDDKEVLRMKSMTRARVVLFGFNEEADLRITDWRIEKSAQVYGSTFKLEYGGSFIPLSLPNVLGKSESYAAAAAAAAGLIFDLNLAEISNALHLNFKGIEANLKFIPGIKDAHLIVGTGEARRASMDEAIELLAELEGDRKIAVLGDMLNLGKWSLEIHEALGKKAAPVADILITVGPRAKLIASGARSADLSKKKILSFDTAAEAGRALQDLIKKGDLILIKGSPEIELDKVVEEVEYR